MKEVTLKQQWLSCFDEADEATKLGQPGTCCCIREDNTGLSAPVGGDLEEPMSPPSMSFMELVGDEHILGLAATVNV